MCTWRIINRETQLLGHTRIFFIHWTILHFFKRGTAGIPLLCLSWDSDYPLYPFLSGLWSIPHLTLRAALGNRHDWSSAVFASGGGWCARHWHWLLFWWRVSFCFLLYGWQIPGINKPLLKRATGGEKQKEYSCLAIWSGVLLENVQFFFGCSVIVLYIFCKFWKKQNTSICVKIVCMYWNIWLSFSRT